MGGPDRTATATNKSMSQVAVFMLVGGTGFEPVTSTV